MSDALFGDFAARLAGSTDEDAAGLLAGLVEGMRIQAAALLMEKLPPTCNLDYQRHPIELLVSSSEIGVRAVSAEKEPFTVEWIEGSIQPGDVFYDVGANVGAYSLIAAKSTANGACIFAFEPSPASFHDLSRNVLLNGCAESIVALPLALGSDNGPLFLMPDPAFAGAAQHRISPAASDKSGALTVIGIRIDDLVERFGLPVPNHAKIDTDGHELEVLLGAERTLALQEWRSIIIELDRGQTRRNREIATLLADAGFDTSVRHERVASPSFPHPEGRQDVYWTFTRSCTETRRPTRPRPAWPRRARSTPLRTAQRRAVTVTLAMVTFLFLLLVFLPEELGDRPYDVFGLRF